MDLENSGNWVQLPESEFQSVRCSLRRADRHHIVFEILDLHFSFRTSQVLEQIQIHLGGKPCYAGRAIVSNILQQGSSIICEAELESRWNLSDELASENIWTGIDDEFADFVESTQEYYRIPSECKNTIADLQMGLLNLREWLGEIETLAKVRSSSNEKWAITEKLMEDLKSKSAKIIEPLFQRFENTVQRVPPHLVPACKAYVKKQIHSLVLGAPFCNRSYRKPLGYAGDYEMVRMMTGNQFQGETLYYKILNSLFLETPPVVAHRLRIDYLNRMLMKQSAHCICQSRPFRVYNLGCGPALEVVRYIKESSHRVPAEFTLVDFNQETLDFAKQNLKSFADSRGGKADFRFVKQSVVQLLKESAKKRKNQSSFDLVYCAGLFDYIDDAICKNLIELLYQLLLPGGLLIVTNVDPSNPSRGWMDYVVDWYLVYRDRESLLKLVPKSLKSQSVEVKANGKGVNIFMEIRKPNIVEQE